MEDEFYDQHQSFTIGDLHTRIWTSNTPIVYKHDGQTVFLTVKKGTQIIMHLESKVDDPEGSHYWVESNIRTNDGEKVFTLTEDSDSTVSFSRSFRKSTVLKFTARPCIPGNRTKPIFMMKSSTIFEIRIHVVG